MRMINVYQDRVFRWVMMKIRGTMPTDAALGPLKSLDIGVCPMDKLPAGMKPLPGYDKPGHENYGHYNFNDGTVMYFIPRPAETSPMWDKAFINDGETKCGLFIDKYPSVGIGTGKIG